MKNIFTFLNNYSTNTVDIDRLLVSAYLQINDINVNKNKFIQSYTINKSNYEYKFLTDFIEIVQSDIKIFDIEILIELFEYVISPSDRIINGAVYTPKYIRDKIVQLSLNRIRKNSSNFKIVDFSCGCGGFLLTASKKLKRKFGLSYNKIFAELIYGLDIKDYASTRSKIILSLLAVSEGEDDNFTFNLFTGDALDFDWKKNIISFKGFDVVLGNPPYVCARNMTEETLKKTMMYEVCKTGNTDLYIPFFQIGIDNLKKDGVLGYITMNSFFKSLNGRNLRDYFQARSLSIKIIDFGIEQVFKSRNTYTCICIIENKRKNYIKFIRVKSKNIPSKEKDYSKIPYSKLDSRSGWNLKDFENILRIESTGIPFGKTFKTKHGIATLKNKVFIFKPVSEDSDYYYLRNGTVHQIEKGICKDIINPNKLRNNVSLGEIKEKVIFPYDNSIKPDLLEEEYFKLNYPKAYNYLKQNKNLLSSRDKGKGKYQNWFAFGRNQSLEKIRNKLFFPNMSDRPPSYIFESDENLLFYNGQALVGHSHEELLLAKKIMESSIFWYYIKTTSKPLNSDYYSFNKIYFKNFGICELSESERRFVLEEKNKSKLDDFFEQKYKIKISEN